MFDFGKLRIMKFAAALLLPLLAPFSIAFAEEAATNLPPDPFGQLEDVEPVPGYPMKVDRSRGSFVLEAENGEYQPGSHFGNWSWTMEAERWGNYYVGLLYESKQRKLGVQVRVGQEAVLKGYAPRTNSLKDPEPLTLGTAYISKPGEYPVTLLTGAESNGPAFRVKGIHFRPAPESEVLGQSIDGTVELAAKTATTYAENMRYEPEPEKNCLGFWTSEEDWAEWVFDVSDPGEFELTVRYGCGGGNEGSEVAVLVNDQTRNFTVEDTGGFQSWKKANLGTVSLSGPGENKLAIVPLEKKGKAVMDIREVVLTPVP